MSTEKKEISTAYMESDAVKQAKAQLEQQLAVKPGAYQSQWQTSLKDTMDKIMNREKFSYDLNGDAFYQQYKDRYIQQGRQAMMDTLGQAAALTGGYGNSYAQMAGQQAYQGYLQGLNDMVPELYQLALDKYTMEGDALMNQYGLLADREDQDYGRYRDTVSDWQSETDRLQGVYDSERDYDYGKFADERNYLYQQGRDAVADAQWQAEFDEAKRQYELSRTSSGSGYYSGGGEESDESAVDGDISASKYIMAAEKFIGTTPDGAWDKNDMEAAMALYGSGDIASVIKAMTSDTDESAGPAPATVSSVSKEITQWQAGGADESEMREYVRGLAMRGDITGSEYAELKKKYPFLS